MRRYHLAIAASFALSLSLCGCAVNPSVRYAIATGPSDTIANQSNLVDSFYRQRNELTIEFKPAKPGDKTSSDAFVVTNRRTEDTRRRIMLLRADSVWSRTTINLTKVENTDLIASAGSEVVDQRGEFITNVGTVLKAVLPLALGAAAKPGEPPCAALTDKACIWALPLDATKDGSEITLAPSLTLKLGPVSVTAVPADDTSFTDFLTRPQHGMLYSSCRAVSLTYSTQTATNRVIYTWQGKIADPNFLEYVAFPRKGQIDFQSQCGVSVKTEKDPTLTPDALLATTVTQVLAIKEAVDKAE